MSAVVVVFVLGLVAGGAVLTASALRGRGRLAPETAEHWLVARASGRPRLRSILAHADRRVVGGAAVAVSLLVVVSAGLAVGWLLDSLDADKGFAAWDETVAEWGAANATAWSTDVLVAVTQAGATSWLALVMAAVAVFDYRRRRRAAVFGFLAAAGIGVTVINNTLKLLIDRERPPVEHLVAASGSSFPSGHSAAAAAAWSAIALTLAAHGQVRVRRVLVAAAIAIAVAVAASRALLGVHWLTDIIAGLIVGWAWFVLCAITFGGRILALGAPATEIAAAEAAIPSERTTKEVRS